MALIIAEDLKGFGMETYIKGHVPAATAIEKNGRITIIPKTDDTGRIFDKCFVEVNFFLPDIHQEANYRLDAIERDVYKIFKNGKAGGYNEQWYNITYSRKSREEEKQLQAHYVHFQLLFEILNTL